MISMSHPVANFACASQPQSIVNLLSEYHRNVKIHYRQMHYMVAIASAIVAQPHLRGYRISHIRISDLSRKLSGAGEPEPLVWVKPQQYAALGALLAESRRAAGVTQDELAARLKKPQSFISTYEHGQRRVPGGMKPAESTFFRTSLTLPSSVRACGRIEWSVRPSAAVRRPGNEPNMEVLVCWS